jgi:hypothetical protein
LIKDIAKWLAIIGRSFKWNVWGNRVNANWRKRYNKELMHLSGYLYILSFVRISWLNWIGHINRVDSKRKESQV